jgi:hypothetical protein
MRNSMWFKLGVVLAGVTGAASVVLPTSANAATKVRDLTLLVQRNFSDCENSNVSSVPPAVVGGEGLVTQRDGGQTTVNIRLTKAAPNTSYNFFLKCHFQLGVIKTDASGHGNNTFTFQTNVTGPIYAFDMYPDGAPLGNKYQSVQINFQ